MGSHCQSGSILDFYIITPHHGVISMTDVFDGHSTPGTPPQPSDIASVKPDQGKPWCPKCRAHTRCKTETKRRKSSASPEGGGTGYRIEKDCWCRHCKGSMFMPSTEKAAGCAGGIAGGLCGGALAAIPIFSFWPNNFDANFGISLIFGGVLTYCFWRLSGHFSGYRGWLRWAKEQQ